MILKRIYSGLYRRIWHLLNKQRYLKLGAKSFINNSLSIQGARNISIGANVSVAYKTWLAAMPYTGYENCLLEIGDGTRIGNFNHIFATKKISIGKNVLTADKVYISDNLHGYEDISIPILEQPIKQIGTVEIGDGTWLGENVCVIGAKIGKNCIIGANSVVTKNILDWSVAVGSPAKIIKRYCFEKNKWLKTDKDGNFINEIKT
jgi:acetyltransferase-like isoleucine patch superfamily enzyme